MFSLVILSFANGFSLLFHVIFLSIPFLSFVLLVVEFLGASCVSKLSKTCAAVKGKVLGDKIDQAIKAMSCTMREAREPSTAKCADRPAAEQRGKTGTRIRESGGGCGEIMKQRLQ